MERERSEAVAGRQAASEAAGVQQSIIQAYNDAYSGISTSTYILVLPVGDIGIDTDHFLLTVPYCCLFHFLLLFLDMPLYTCTRAHTRARAHLLPFTFIAKRSRLTHDTTHHLFFFSSMLDVCVSNSGSLKRMRNRCVTERMSLIRVSTYSLSLSVCVCLCVFCVFVFLCLCV